MLGPEERMNRNEYGQEGNAKECSKYCTIALISQASKLMLKNSPSQASEMVDKTGPIGLEATIQSRASAYLCQEKPPSKMASFSAL